MISQIINYDIFKTEFESKEIISKLTNIKDISLYLKNPNEYIRRLAIIKLSEIYSIESIEHLKNILDDNLESQVNKSLAFDIIKNISNKLSVDLYIYNKGYNVDLNTYLNSITFNNSNITINYPKPSSVLKEIFHCNSSIRNCIELEYDHKLDYKKWIIQFVAFHFKKISLKLKLFPKLFVYNSKKMIQYLNSKRKTRHNKIKILAPKHKEKINIQLILFNILYVILSPVRFIVHNIKLISFSFVFLLLIIFFSPFSNEAYSKYVPQNLQSKFFQIRLVSTSSIDYTWTKFKNFFGIHNPLLDTTLKKIQPDSETSNNSNFIKKNKIELTNKMNFSISLRKSPSLDGDKFSDIDINKNEKVIYLEESTFDLNNNEWLYVNFNSQDGWILAKWFTDKGVDLIGRN